MKCFYGVANDAARFLQDQFLLDETLWSRFAEVFRTHPDGENQGWRGEYWGKMMRGACLIYAYTQDERLYRTLTDSVSDMLTVADGDGRVSSYAKEKEFGGWDIWGRKYVMLGLEYYLDICKDEGRRQEIVCFLRRLADYILEHIGPAKTKITRASCHWYGVNSSSILEPMVRLYEITKDKRYLDFASYIVEEGGAYGIPVFELAYENKLLPYQYGVSKAYELTSCFEGLLAYSLATGIEKYKIATIHYAEALLASEISIIGGSGCTHELFDHTATRQTAEYDGVMQETCVTVTLMKFFSRMLALTGDSKYADAIETSFYNAYLGALNRDRRESPYVHAQYPDKEIKRCILPFDSYSPLTPGTRGRVVGGTQLLADGSYYGCCACIGAAGVGVFMQDAIAVSEEGITVNFYESGRLDTCYQGVPVRVEIQTKYPADGKIVVKISADTPVSFDLKIRNPVWMKPSGGYSVFSETWTSNLLELEFPMPTELHFPQKWSEDRIYTSMIWDENYCGVEGITVYHRPEDDRYFAVTRGPLTLASDGRTGKAAQSRFAIPQETALCENEVASGVPCLIKLKLIPKNGEAFYLVDYAHAGQDWTTPIAAWLPLEGEP